MPGMLPFRSRRFTLLLLGVVMVLAVLSLVWLFSRPAPRPAGPATFQGDLAYEHVLAQMEFGPRITGTAEHTAAGDYIVGELRARGWEVEIQPFVYQATSARNFIAKANLGRGPVLILGAHYDTRRRADQDAQNPTAPVPGANDGASGVAVLLELARSVDLESVPYEVWLAFFDAEDNGNLDGWDWIAGSSYMADNLTVTPVAMILVDMIGDADQQIYFDQNSDPELSARVWRTAASLGYDEYFLPVARYAMIDDHIPFARRGIPSIDIIDFDYPYWHTTADTADKVSAASLEHVGRTLETFLEELLITPLP